MVVIDEVLIVGVGMHCLNMATDHAIFVIKYLEHWGNGVCGARGSRNYLVFRLNLVMVNTVNDIFQVAFAWRGQHDFTGAL